MMAFYALLAASVAIALYVWVRFEWQFGVAGLFALVHDVSLTLGLFALVINAILLMVAGWLSGVLGLGLAVDGFSAALVGALIMAVATWVINLVLGSVGLRR